MATMVTIKDLERVGHNWYEGVYKHPNPTRLISHVQWWAVFKIDGVPKFVVPQRFAAYYNARFEDYANRTKRNLNFHSAEAHPHLLSLGREVPVTEDVGGYQYMVEDQGNGKGVCHKDARFIEIDL